MTLLKTTHGHAMRAWDDMQVRYLNRIRYTEGHTTVYFLAAPSRTDPPTLHPSLPLVLSSVLRVVSLPLVVPTLPIVRR